MVSSLEKRIVFCGNYRWWYPEWRYLDGDNSSMTKNEFFGEEYMNRHIFDRALKKGVKTAVPRMKLNRVIDSSEYVVRCNFGKTSVPTVGFEYKKLPSASYGAKTDILSFWGDFTQSAPYDGLFENGVNRPDFNHETTPIPKRQEGLIHNNFNDLSVRMGYPSRHHNSQSLSVHNSQDENDEILGRVLEYYGNRMIASQLDEINKKESWISMNYLYRKFIVENTDLDKLRSVQQIEKANRLIEFIEDVHGVNVKFLAVDDYIALCQDVSRFAVSYEELKNMISGKDWAKDLLGSNKSHPLSESDSWMEEESVRSMWMDSVRLNYHVGRGLECIWIIMNDPRFKHYDKYIIGTMGINEYFRTGEDCLLNEFAQYQWTSHYIKNGSLKYLPEHVDRLYEKYNKTVLSKGVNLNI